jgi:predicted alpha/beta hydrolase
MHGEVLSTLEEKIANVSSNATYVAGSGAAIAGAMSVNGWAAVAGALCAVGTFLVNWYYKHKAMMLEERRLDLDEHG